MTGVLHVGRDLLALLTVALVIHSGRGRRPTKGVGWAGARGNALMGRAVGPTLRGFSG